MADLIISGSICSICAVAASLLKMCEPSCYASCARTAAPWNMVSQYELNCSVYFWWYCSMALLSWPNDS